LTAGTLEPFERMIEKKLTKRSLTIKEGAD